MLHFATFVRIIRFELLAAAEGSWLEIHLLHIVTVEDAEDVYNATAEMLGEANDFNA